MIANASVDLPQSSSSLAALENASWQGLRNVEIYRDYFVTLNRTVHSSVIAHNHSQSLKFEGRQ